ncbi:MAG: Na+/H+ antiporter NhaA [Bacteroidales bacterium]|nr:Na+/H+ antiporter NhaA [Bacteroidales bacterium]MBN2819271.1 Na+/H+ antiporter NhaA [Bacteroidales bacterium]
MWTNSGFGETYHHFWETHLSIDLGFFVAGFEIKRELIAGELSSFKQAALPISAAIGGMIIPAVLFLIVNKNPNAMAGWGIPMATDIAFSLGVLSLLGKRVPLALKIFLLAFALVDVLGAVIVIAIFYNHDIQWSYLIIGLGLTMLLIVFNKLKIKSIPPIMILGWVIWYLFLK